MSEKSTTCQLRDARPGRVVKVFAPSSRALRLAGRWLPLDRKVRYSCLLAERTHLSQRYNTRTTCWRGNGTRVTSTLRVAPDTDPTADAVHTATSGDTGRVPAPTPSLVKGRLLRLAVNWFCEIPGEHTDVGLRLGEDVGCMFKLWRWWQWTDQNVTARLSIPVAMAAIDLKESGRRSARRDFHR